MTLFLIFNPQFLFAKILHGYESKHCYTSLHSRIAGNACLSLPKIVLYDLSHCCSLIIYIYTYRIPHQSPINIPVYPQCTHHISITSPFSTHLTGAQWLFQSSWSLTTRGPGSAKPKSSRTCTEDGSSFESKNVLAGPSSKCIYIYI